MSDGRYHPVNRGYNGVWDYPSILIIGDWGIVLQTPSQQRRPDQEGAGYCQGTGYPDQGRAGLDSETDTGGRERKPDIREIGVDSRDATTGLDIAHRTARVVAAVDETARLLERVEQISQLRAQESQRLHSKVTEARQIAHEYKGKIQIIVGTIEILKVKGILPSPHVDEIINTLTESGILFDRLHALVREMEPEI